MLAIGCYEPRPPRRRLQDVNLELESIIAAAGYTRHFTPAQHIRGQVCAEASKALPGLLWGWALGPVLLALLCWVRQRLLYRAMLREIGDAAARLREFEQVDMLAASGLDPSSDTRTRLLDLRKEAYDDVVQPLEPFVVVIILFAIPQIVGVTSGCQDESQAAFNQVGLTWD